MRLNKEWTKFSLPLFLLAGAGFLVIWYFVKNPGGAMAARILTYQHIGWLLAQHILMVLISSFMAIMTAVPLGIIVSRPRLRVAGVIIENTVNIAQTVPSIAVLALFFTFLGLGFSTAVFALWLYSLLPVLRNTYAGMKLVPAEIVEAAKGMGMSPRRVLTRIELPLAIPVIMAGIRTAVVINVGTATLATFIGAGGLGHLIVTGITVQRHELLFTGSVLSALLAIFCDHMLGGLESLVRPG